MIAFEKVRALLGMRRRALEPEWHGVITLRSRIDEAASAWPFTDAAIDVSPTDPGVYLLYRDGQLTYIGLASHVRAELASHRRGAYGECTRAATAFVYELARDPRTLYLRLLDAHRARHAGRVPSCNEP